jgi:hypothetical protein
MPSIGTCSYIMSRAADAWQIQQVQFVRPPSLSCALELSCITSAMYDTII